MDLGISSRFSFDDDATDEAKICVVGVGGGGGNAINSMVARGIVGVEFVAINTDSQALAANKAPHKIQAGKGLTKGLGAGARPMVGAEAVEESQEEIEALLKGFDMVFITAGMGGGTGTGGAPVVASIARRLGILTVGIVTRPFDCEGRKRYKSAMEGIDLLKENVDTLIVIPNERLLDIAEANTSLIDAFSRVDDVLYNATRGISDLITVHGLINLDFADVKTTMQNGGTALMGSATASGENRSEKAAIEAISSPLLDGLSIQGATNVLVNITAGRSLGIREATGATNIIQREAGDDVEVIFGTVIDESMGEELRVTVIATGFDKPKSHHEERRARPSVVIDQRSGRGDYKGTEALKVLDEPAVNRRQPTVTLHTVAKEESADPAPAPPPGNGRTTIRRVNLDDLKERPERIRKDNTDVPAFLRKMMD